MPPPPRMSSAPVPPVSVSSPAPPMRVSSPAPPASCTEPLNPEASIELLESPPVSCAHSNPASVWVTPSNVSDVSVSTMVVALRVSNTRSTSSPSSSVPPSSESPTPPPPLSRSLPSPPLRISPPDVLPMTVSAPAPPDRTTAPFVKAEASIVLSPSFPNNMACWMFASVLGLLTPAVVVATLMVLVPPIRPPPAAVRAAIDLPERSPVNATLHPCGSSVTSTSKMPMAVRSISADLTASAVAFQGIARVVSPA